MKKQELMKYIGSINQLGGVREFTYSDGKAKGVRGIDVNLGDLRFTVLPDRCMDIAEAYYKGKAVSWFSSTGVVSNTYYEKDETGWLRGFYGGLITTCGLKNVGRPSQTEGLHGRIAYTPAEKVCVFADWIDDDYVIKISGEMRETVAMGYNLRLKRTISAKLFESVITVEDTVVNDGLKEEPIALCYHCNFGYPLVCEKAKIINVPEKYSEITAPIPDIEEECIPVEYKEATVTAGIENETMGAYITYETKTLPDFLIWKMFREGVYVVGLEPRTTALGGDNIIKNNAFVNLKPYEEYKTKLKFEFVEKTQK